MIVDEIKHMVKQARASIVKKLNRTYQYQAFFSTDDGKKILADLSRYCKVNQQVACKDMMGKIDALQLAEWNGRRDVFAYIMSNIDIKQSEIEQLNLDLKDYLNFEKEQ